jgi:NDP-sugar pyrophosphorylase family protein
LDAVVMAAGEGTRLRPLTERWPKPLLPIDGRPVIASLLRELARAGCRRATVVTGRLGEELERLVGDGKAYGLEVAFARQPAPDGSADAVVRALRAGAPPPPSLVVAADTVFTAGDVGRFAAAYAASGADGALAVRRHPPPAPNRHPVSIADGRVVRVVDDDPGNPLAAAPLWGLGPAVEPFLAGLTGPPFELGEAYQRAIDAGLEVTAVEIGRTRDLTRPVDLVIENFPYLETP